MNKIFKSHFIKKLLWFQPTAPPKFMNGHMWDQRETHLFKQRLPDVLRMSSSVSCQFLMDPFTNPDTMMKPRTRTLTQVNILLTMADSFTPRVKSPENVHKQDTEC